jgi:uncharacterized protein YukE
MAETLRADQIDQFKRAADKAQAFNDQSQAALARLQRDAQELRANWQSVAPGRAFDVNMDTWSDDMRIMHQKMNDIIKMLGDTAGGYQAVVDAQAQAVAKVYAELNRK